MVASTIADLLAKDLPKLPFYIEGGILPKSGLMLLAGPTKLGKSFVIKTMMKNLAEGNPLFGCPLFNIPSKVRTLYVENEIGELGLQERARKVFGTMNSADAENMFYVPKEQAHKMKLDDLSGDGHHAWNTIIRSVAPQVVIIDPIAAFHTSDENDTIAVEKLYNRISEMQAINPQRAMSVVIVHHTGKANRAFRPSNIDWDPLDAYNSRGSSKFPDRPDTLFTLNRLSDLKNIDHKAWELEGRFVCRRSAGFDDFYLTVNEKDDGQVKFSRFKTSVPTIILDRTKPPAAGLKPKSGGDMQLLFQPFDPI